MLLYYKSIGVFSFDASYYPMRFHLKLTCYLLEFCFVCYQHKVDLNQDFKA